MNCLLRKRKLRFGEIKLFADGQIVDKGENCPQFPCSNGIPWWLRGKSPLAMREMWV